MVLEKNKSYLTCVQWPIFLHSGTSQISTSPLLSLTRAPGGLWEIPEVHGETVRELPVTGNHRETRGRPFSREPCRFPLKV